MNSREFAVYCQKNKVKVDKYLNKYLYPSYKYPEIIHQAMRYSIFAGGKRIRPLLVIAAFESLGGRGAEILPAACALEMMHTFSLIHDDLPCMDNDDLRRGLPTCHKKFGDANAVLAGDALCILAFELLAKTNDCRIIKELAMALGSNGMIGGQVVDIISEGKKISKKTLKYIHEHKTGALICSSLRIGVMAAGANTKVLNIITEYGNQIGLAFQIADDILDVEGNTEILGKQVGSDLKQDKNTYPLMYGLAYSKRMAKKCADKAKNVIKVIKLKTNVLSYFADYVVSRIN